MGLKKPDNAILLVSDITRGMKSIGSKALLPITKTSTIIEHQIQYLKKFYYPINIFICTGFEHDKILKITSKYKNIQYVYNEKYELDNQIGSLVDCLKQYNLDNAIIINNGILLLDKIPIDKNNSSIFVTNKLLKTHFDIGSNDLTNVQYLFYDLPNKWLECAYFNDKSISKILELSKKKNYDKLFLFEMINILMDNGIQIDTVNLDKNLPIKVNNIKDLNIAKKNYEKYLYNKVK